VTAILATAAESRVSFDGTHGFGFDPFYLYTSSGSATGLSLALE
jgi:hypothetical protein